MPESARFSRRAESIDIAATVLLIPVLIWEVTRPDAHKFAVLAANATLFVVLLVALVMRVRTEEWRSTPVGVKGLEIALLAVAIPGIASVAGPLRIFRVLRVPLLGVRTLRGLRARLERDGPLFVLLMASVTVVAGALMVLEFERYHDEALIHGLGDALWWAVTTMTTVGYGDEFPRTPGGRAVGTVVMLIGISLFGLVTALLAQWFLGTTAAHERTRDETAALAEQVAALRAELAAAEARRVGDGGGAERP